MLSVLLVGVSGSGKTNLIRILFNKQSGDPQQTYDINLHRYGSIFIIDTPCISSYNNFNHLYECCVQSTHDKKVTKIMYFMEKNIDNRYFIKSIYSLCVKENIQLYVIGDEIFSDDIKNIDNKSAIEIIQSASRETFGNIPTKNLIFIGAYNTGKSTIVNNLVNCDVKNISSIPNTTKHLSSIYVKINDELFCVLDSIGLCNTTRHYIYKLKNLIGSIDRAFIVCSQDQWRCQLYNNIVNYLNKKNINYTFIVNKSDLGVDSETYKTMLNRLSIYTNKNNIVFLNKYCFRSKFFKNIMGWMQKPHVSQNKLTEYLKTIMPGILYTDIIENKKNFKINIYKKRNSKEININRVRNVIVNEFHVYHHNIQISII